METLDALVIGAGVSGLYQLHRLLRMGWTVTAVEAGSGVGGTWYWNRYPGARFDSESYTYGYAFDDELLDEWQWTEHFSAQPETLRYLEHVADRFKLREHIRFNTRVEAARWDESTRTWRVTTGGGEVFVARFIITAVGALSIPIYPVVDGVDDFPGPAFHTARWPADGVELAGKRIGVVGTGATGVQVIQEVAKVAGHLTVFQRRPNWCAPLNNGTITDDEQALIHETQRDLLARCAQTYGGFLHDAERLKSTEVTAEERERFWEQRYAERGFGIWFGNYRDVMVDEDANARLSDFVARKIRERVHDRKVAELLIPKDHGFGTRRVPLESGYYEVYNQPNVTLVDLLTTPIERITQTGIRTTDRDYDLDVIVYATGFDAVTGAFDHIDIRGVDGVALKDAWADGPRTFLGLAVPGFPNLFTIAGAHNVATFCNMPRCIEQNVDWLAALLAHAQSRDVTRIEATAAAAEEWTAHVYEMAERLLMNKVDSWFHGINANLPGRVRRPLIYAGGIPTYREKCEESAAANYAGFAFG